MRRKGIRTATKTSLACRPCWEAPFGTYVGWNLATTGWYGPNASNGPGSVGQVFAGAGNSGGYLPFWDTQVHRQAANDPRLSLQGAVRYPCRLPLRCNGCCEGGCQG